MRRGIGILGVAALFAFSACERAQETLTGIEVEPLFAEAERGAVESATGSGHFHAGLILRTFTFSAIGLSDGKVRGIWEIKGHSKEPEREYPIRYAVECLVVMDNVAYVGGYRTWPNSPPVRQAIFKAVDNGEGDNAEPDRISWTYIYQPGVDILTDFCSNPGPRLDGKPLWDVEGGNVQVRGG